MDVGGKPSRIVSSLLEGRICNKDEYINYSDNKKHSLSTKYIPGSVLSA